MKIVGIGASAGGIAALQEFLQNLSPETRAAFVIVQHLSPDFKSIMQDLLNKYTEMPVKQITEDTILEADHVYVMPSNKNVTYNYGMLKLHDRDPNEKLNLPIDKFFHSLGNGKKKKAIGVVLSGSGTDGSRGARTIKEQDGVVIVQDPDTAEFDSMPQALIKLDIADSILSPSDIATRLGDIINLDASEDDVVDKKPVFSDKAVDQMSNIIRLVSKNTDISFVDYKLATLYRRIEKNRILHEYADLETYYHNLEKSESLLRKLSKDFLISVTRFFRDQEFFAHISEQVLPELFESVGEKEVIRIWVVACSTGEEAYSLGMTLMEYMEKNNHNNDFKIFASDVSEPCIDIAAQGCFNASIISDVPLYYLNKYFTEEHGLYYVKPELREKVIFAVHDAMKDPPFIKMNIISCRNFLIYLKPEVQNKILKTFYFALNKSQYLLLGPSESLGELSNVFSSINRNWNIYKKQQVEALNSENRFNISSESWTKKKNKKLNFYHKSSDADFLKESTDVNEPFSEYLLGLYVPNTIFVKENLEVLYMKGNFNFLLSIPSETSVINLENMLPDNAAYFMRDGVRMALKNNDIQHFKNVSFKNKDNFILTNLTFQKVTFPEFKEAVVKIEIDFEAQKEKFEVNKVTNDINLESYTEGRLERLERALDEEIAKSDQLRMLLESTSEELNTSNQELLASNEELQSTNEELQSLNEELHTVNTELQYKNVELIKSNNDMNNLLNSTKVGTIFLDKKLYIRKFTPAIKKQFNLIDSDINRPISSFTNKLNNVNLKETGERVLKTGKSFEKEITDVSGKKFILRVVPYESEQKTDGIVISLIDIDDFTREKWNISDSATFPESIFKYIEVDLLIFNKKENILYAGGKLESADLKNDLMDCIKDFFEKDTLDKIKKAVQQVKKSNNLQAIKSVKSSISDKKADITIFPIFNNFIKEPCFGFQLSNL